MSYLKEAINESFKLFEASFNHLEEDIINTINSCTENNIPKEYIDDLNSNEKCSKSAAKNILIAALKKEPASLYIGTVATSDKDREAILNSGKDIRSHVWVKIIDDVGERILQTNASEFAENMNNLIPMVSINFTKDMSFDDRKNKLIKELYK